MTRNFSGCVEFLANPWDFNSGKLAGEENVLQRYCDGVRDLLRGDMNSQMAEWVVRGLVDPAGYATNAKSRVHVLCEIRRSLERDPQVLADSSIEEKKSFIRSATQAVWQMVERERNKQNSVRLQLDLKERRRLLLLAGDPPRCWLTGYKFNKVAIQKFLGNSEQSLKPELYIDPMLPIGVRAEDLRIEVDHVVPFSAGGGGRENLRLACGWANRFKSNNSNIFSAPYSDPVQRKSDNTYSENGFTWLVRAIGVVRSCCVDGCTNSADDHAMRPKSAYPHGQLTPASLRIVCEDHDIDYGKRLVARNDYLKRIR